MFFKKVSLLALAFALSTSSLFAADDFAAKVQKSMTKLKELTAVLGADAKTEGECKVGDKKVPNLFFGTTGMCSNYKIVDEVKKKNGGTATLFVKSGDEYVRVTTNVQKDDGSRAVGTILDPKGKAIVQINNGKAFYGDVEILGKPYTTGYEPIVDKDKKVIGIYYVGYPKITE